MDRATRVNQPNTSTPSPSLALAGSEFADAATETSFLQHHLATLQVQLRTALLFSVLFYLAFTVTDIAVLGLGRDALFVFGGRIVVAMVALVGIWLMRWKALSVAMTRLAATGMETVAMTVFMLMVAYRPDEFAWHAMSMAIMLIVVYMYIPNRLRYASAVGAGATLVFFLLALLRGRLSTADLLTMGMLLALANIFGYAAARRYQRLWRDEYKAQSVLKELAGRDHLTGCYNRRYLYDDLLDGEISRAQRFRLHLTVIMCDLDHFKVINDSYGHAGGDAVLRAFAHLLRSHTRDQVDAVVRYGGEEFLLVLPETDLHGGVLLAERLRLAFEAISVPHGAGHHISATASFGVLSVDFAHNLQPLSSYGLVTSADALLYSAKAEGRNRVKALLHP